MRIKGGILNETIQGRGHDLCFLSGPRRKGRRRRARRYKCVCLPFNKQHGRQGDATNEAIIKAVEDAGYGASPKGADGTSAKPASDDALKDTETPKLKRRLVYSIGFLLVLMYLTMGHNMLHFPLPAFLDGNLYGMGITQLLLALIVMFINRAFFISGFKSMKHLAPNMDTLLPWARVYLSCGASMSCMISRTLARMVRRSRNS